MLYIPPENIPARPAKKLWFLQIIPLPLAQHAHGVPPYFTGVAVPDSTDTIQAGRGL